MSESYANKRTHMKIVIGGSMAFAKEQIAVRDILAAAGHTVLLTDDIAEYVEKPAIKSSFEEELRISLEYDIMRSFFNQIAESDAFLVCNLPKNGISGYLGTSVLMELGLAYYWGNGYTCCTTSIVPKDTRSRLR